MEQINIFTDGSAINNGKSNASGGIGIYMAELNFKLSLPYLIELATNQRCELYAILRALEIYLAMSLDRQMPKSIRIHSDSMYSINVCSKWIPGWKKKDWKTADGKEVKNLCLIQQIDHIQSLYYRSGVKIEYFFVGSHLDEPTSKRSLEYFRWKGNNVADGLAKKASVSYLKRFNL